MDANLIVSNTARTGAGLAAVYYSHLFATNNMIVHNTTTAELGEGVIRLRQIHGEGVLEFRVRGEEYRVVDIPPGYTHSIENVGTGEMVTLFWSSEQFDPAKPDTIFDPVLRPKGA